MKRELGIARCGLACCLCSENVQCPGCSSDGCKDKNWCENRRCSVQKDLEGCYECPEDCRKGLLKKIKPYGFKLFIQRYGVEELLDCLERNEKNGVVYHREGITGDYDDFDDVERLISFIRTGERADLKRMEEQEFERRCGQLFQQFDYHGKMVLSTSRNDKVTSRMMSVVVYNGAFYFQTDQTSRKCGQIRRNSYTALCMDNIQVEGNCEEIGCPSDNKAFCELYYKYFPSSYERYTKLKNERLFVVKPLYIQKWLYENGEPFLETFDFGTCTYRKKPYQGE